MITVREATESDLERIATLSRLWEREGVTLGHAADPVSWLREHLGTFFVVAESDGELVGYAFAESQRTGEQTQTVLPVDTRVLAVESLYVLKDKRGQGTGERLVLALHEAAASAGTEHGLVFTATDDVDRILAFYRRLGYRPWGVQLVR